MINELNPNILKILKWLLLNTDLKNNRPILKCVNLIRSNDNVILQAANGFVFVQAKISNINIDMTYFMKDMQSSVYFIKIESSKYFSYEIFDDTYPDIKLIFSEKPTIIPPVDKYISILCSINPKIISNYLPNFISNVVIRLNGEQINISGEEYIDDYHIEILGTSMPCIKPDNYKRLGFNKEEILLKNKPMWLEADPII